MRRGPAPLLLLLLLAGCPTLDVSRPIALVADSDWTPFEVQTLRQAAQCWNDEFGTLLTTDPTGVEQQARVSYSDFLCTYAGGRTDTPPPVHIYVCPSKYWYRHGEEKVRMFFGVLLHEVGHVVNIVEHASGPAAVMTASADQRSESYFFFPPSFSDEDRALFREANPGFAGSPRCEGGVAITAAYSPPQCLCR